jgi:hypothetical protein
MKTHTTIANAAANPRPHLRKAATYEPDTTKIVSEAAPGRLSVPTTWSAACPSSTENVDPPASMNPRAVNIAASTSSTFQTFLLWVE